jgi:hypothetical protein
MTRAVVLAALAACAGLAVPPARAEEPHLEFARALRAQGMPDLAADYLQRLSAKPPADLAAVLPLEIAKARLDQAALEGDAKKRDAQFRAAQAAFEQFLTANAQHPQAVEARFELARLTALQGKYLLDRARRQEAKAAQRDLTAQARPLFAAAAAKLKDAAAAIDAKLQQPNANKQDLARLRLQAQLEEGINLVHQAVTILDNKEAKQRAEVLNQARAVLGKLSRGSDENPVTWQAKVWLGRLADEEEDRAAARKAYETLAAEKAPAAEAAARTASYLLLRLQAREEAVPNRAAHVQKVVAGCEDWLKRFRGAANTPEGQGVRYVLASMLEEQGMAGVMRPQQPGAPPRVSGAYRQTLTRAERLLKELADAENDFSDRARARRAGILSVLVAERARDIKGLSTFEECYLTAQVDGYELSHGKQTPEERQRRQGRIITALRRGLSLAGRNDAPRDVADARLMLAYAYLVSGEPYAAAVLGEHLGRSGAAGARSPEAIAYALEAYAAIVAGDRARRAGEDEVKADQRRLRRLAAYMEKTYPDEAATDVARHQLGNFLLDDGLYAEAVTMLSRIAPSYAGLAQARYQEGSAAQKAQAAKVALPAVQKADLLKRAVADLEKVPAPAPGAGEDSTLAACMAKLQLGNLYLLDERPDGANYARAEALGKDLAELAPKLALEAKFVPQVTAEAVKLQTAGVLGRAFQLVKADKAEEAQKLLAPLVARLRKELADPKAAEPYEPLREVQRQVLLVVLRAAIQENKADQARQALELLQKATPAAGVDSANDRLLRLVRDLKREADELKAKGEAAKRDRLDKGLVAFLDELAKPQRLTPPVRLFLAQAFSGLERHDRAAELLKDITPPKPGDEDATRFYHFARVALAREYRLGKQFNPAKQVLDEALASWGKTNLDVRKEVVFLLGDAGNYAGAARTCREMQGMLQRSRTDYERAVLAERAADEAERAAKTEEERTKAQTARAEAQAVKARAQPLREAYWEFYFYEVRAVLKNDLKRAKDAADKETRLARVAAAIKKLEDGQDDFGGGDLKQKYLELVEGEPLLKKKYFEAQGRRLYADAVK